jgi:hypothetical protein
VPEARTIAIACCGTSGGIHAALFAVHMRDLPKHAAAFLTAALLLGLVGLVLALRPDATEGPVAAAVLFAALIVAYPLARHEPVDFVAVVSKAVEAIGLVAGLRLTRVSPTTAATAPSAAVLPVFLLFVAAGLMVGAGHAGHG